MRVYVEIEPLILDPYVTEQNSLLTLGHVLLRNNGLGLSVLWGYKFGPSWMTDNHQIISVTSIAQTQQLRLSKT